MWAKQSTAATLIVGPILDSAGVEYASAVIGDLSISKNGNTLTAMASAATLTHIANGQYTLVMTTGNLDTLGRAQITCNKSTYQMPPVNLMVVPATVFDALVTNAVNATGGLVGATAAVSAVAGYIGASGAAINGTNVNTLSGHDPGTTLGTSTLTQTQVSGGAYALNSASFGFNAALDLTTTQKTSVTTAATAATPIAASVSGNVGGSVASVVAGVDLSTTALGAIWNRLTSSMSVAGSIGKKLADWVVGTIDTYTGNTPQTGDSYARLGAPSGASVAADIAAVPTAAQNAAAVEAAILNEGDATALLAAIAAKVEEFLINEGDATATIAAIAAACNAAVAAGTVGTNAATAATQASAANTKIGTPVVSVSADIAAVKAETALTVADTNELQTDWANGGRLDLILDAAGSAGDPWITELPGSYAEGTAGYIIGNNLDEPVSGAGGGGGDAEEATSQEILAQVIANGAALSGSPINATGRVSEGGTLTVYIGDDWVAANSTSQRISVADPTGALYTKLDAIGAANLRCGASRAGRDAGLIEFDVVDVHQVTVDAALVCQIELETTEAGVGLMPANDYEYQVKQLVGTDSFVEIQGRLILRPARV